jgi:hypothetical protein
MSRVMVKSFIAAAPIGFRRLVAMRTAGGSLDREVLPAAAVGDPIIGVCVTENGAVTGEAVDVLLIGVEPVVAGAAITRGSLVTTDAAGRMIPAVATNRAAGVALQSGVLGDHLLTLITPSVL